ncbi:MAG: efflux RND transporter periplasmic adaptor subunit [Ramlibacter sp.]
MSDAPTPASNPRRLRRRTVWLGALVALLVLAGLGWLGWTYTRPGAAGGPGGAMGAGGPGGFGAGRLATTVGVAVAEKADLPVTLEALGTVTPQATVRVRAQVSGILTRVAFKEGQLVRRGDLLAEIDPRQYEMALQQAMGQRQRDEAQLEAARLTLERYRTLLSQDSIARQEVDSQAALVKQLEGAVVIDRANEGTARLNLGYTRIVAPISGRVGLRTVDVGNLVNSGDTNGVAVITQVSPIDVLFAVPQDQAGNLLRGNNMAATALDRTRATVLDKGVFASLDNQIDTTTGTVKAKARFDNAQQNLFPSQFVNLRLQVQTIRDAIMVPVAALRQGGTGTFVFVLQQDRTVKIRPVTRGAATVDKVQITAGLQAGERVITEGADRLKDGSFVVLPGDAPRSQRQMNRSQGAPAPAPARAGSAPAAATAPPAAPPGVAPGAAQGPAAATRPAPVPAAAPPAAPPATAAAKPTAEQRERFLASAPDDEARARRQALLARIDQGDPEALARWQQILERLRQRGAGGGGQGQ